MIRLILRLWATFIVAVKRLLAQRWLALATLLGLLMSIALALSIPMYADAVYYRVLRQKLWGKPDVAAPSDLPLTFLFRFNGGGDTSKEWEDIEAVDAYMRGPGLETLRLPPRYVLRHFRTDNLGLYPAEGIATYDRGYKPLAWVSFAFTGELEKHITLLEGHLPAVSPPGEDNVVEVLLNVALADETGVQVGESYVTHMNVQTGDTAKSLLVPVRVAGIWEVTDKDDPYWFYKPEMMQDMLFVPEETFNGRISDYLENEIYVAVWYLMLDGSGVHSRDVGLLVRRILTVQQRVSGLLAGTRLDASPMDALWAYGQAARLLTILLYAFSVPIMGLVLAFVSMTVGLVVSHRRNEIAVLRSRGATLLQLVGIAVLEAVVLAGIALAAGFPVGERIAHLIGKTRSFLDFSLDTSLRVDPTMATLYLGLAVAGLTLVAQTLPTLGAARHTIITYKQEQARLLRPPWWQRVWLDVLLLIPTIYGAYTLRAQGSLAMPGVSTDMAADPFQNPLLFLIPALGICALTLVILRILPFIMGGIAWIAARFKTVGLLMAARHLARTPSFYSAPLVLLVMTLSLSAFVASLAQTLDRNLYDQSYYRFGADMRVAETGEETVQEIGALYSGDSSTDTGARWYFLPVNEHLSVPGVERAARAGRYEAQVVVGNVNQPAEILGIDRYDFQHVTFWRDDFSAASLGEMMNALASSPDAVLLSNDFMRQHILQPGDTLHINVDTFGQRTPIEFKVAGGFELFPTWYPADEREGPLFVANLDYIFQEAGGNFPYDVWLRTDSSVPYEEIAEGISDKGVDIRYWDAPQTVINAEQQRPQRQGLFGVLSVGFAGAALLTVIGFALYAFFSFRRRFIELGILRAIGLSARQMIAFLGWELVFLMGIGLSAGTGLGVWMSNFFIPYLQVGSGPEAQTPPFVVQIHWPSVFQIYLLFGGLFVFALVVLVVLLMRMKIFQAVKLGETV